MHVEVDRMYAEERQQAMAHLISRRGRLSVADWTRGRGIAAGARLA